MHDLQCRVRKWSKYPAYLLCCQPELMNKKAAIDYSKCLYTVGRKEAQGKLLLDHNCDKKSTTWY